MHWVTEVRGPFVLLAAVVMRRLFRSTRSSRRTEAAYCYILLLSHGPWRFSEFLLRDVSTDGLLTAHHNETYRSGIYISIIG